MWPSSLAFLLLFSPCVISQDYLNDYWAVADALDQGHHTVAILNGRLCETDYPEGTDPVVVIPLDVWSRLDDGQLDFITFNHAFIAPNANFLLAMGTLDETGKATMVVVEISQMDGTVVDRRGMACQHTEGAYFLKKAAAQPTHHLETYDDLKQALLEGRHVTFLGFGDRCQGAPADFPVFHAGTYQLQYYIDSDPETGEEYIALIYEMSAVNAVSDMVFYNSHMLVDRDGVVTTTTSEYNMNTWENEYPYPDPMYCTLDDTVMFLDRLGEEYEEFSSFFQVERALLDGKEIQLVALESGCTETFRNTDREMYWGDVGVRLAEWQQFSDENGHEIRFAQNYVAIDGTIRLQEYSLRDEDVLDIRVSTWNPLTLPDAPSEVVNYACDMGMGLVVSAPIKSSFPATSYFAIYGAMLNGWHLEARVSFRDCENPSGSGLDFWGVAAGFYLQEMFLSDPDTPISMIFTAAYTLVTDWSDGEGRAINSITMAFEQSNKVTVIPGLWTVEDGALVNKFGEGFYLECQLGRDVVVYASVQD